MNKMILTGLCLVSSTLFATEDGVLSSPNALQRAKPQNTEELVVPKAESETDSAKGEETYSPPSQTSVDGWNKSEPPGEATLPGHVLPLRRANPPYPSRVEDPTDISQRDQRMPPPNSFVPQPRRSE